MAYVCTSCGGSVSDEEHQAGKTTCETPGCDRQGQPLQRKEEGAGSAGAPAQTMQGGDAQKKPWWKFW